MNDVMAQAALEKKRALISAGTAYNYEFRMQMLDKLRESIEKHESLVIEALKADLGKGAFEAYVSEIGFTYEEIGYAKKHLKKWMKAKRVRTPVVSWPARSYIRREPLGVVLIIAPWNYPFQLMLAPLIGAIAGGNAVVLKPSELAPNTAKAIEAVISSAFPEEYISVVQGDGREVVPALFEEGDFDHVFFTGSVEVGRIVGTMAAERHIPATLELGGKSPVIVHRDAAIEEAARRVMYGKTINAGQTCVAPDYLLVHREVKERFLAAAKQALEEFFPDGPFASDQYGKMIHEGHYKKVKGYLDEGTILYGGQTDDASLRIAPTIIEAAAPDSGLLTEEIFGPILPVLTYERDEEVIGEVRKRPNPLSLYVFTRDKNFERLVTEGLAFGGGCVNDTIIHLINPKLPFGGLRTSGKGSYHGYFGFEAMTHAKSIVKSWAGFGLKLRYPPYSDGTYKLVRRVFK
ncbi:MAG: aldehyde dehydrogenase family protein [Spirochaetales bacterium]